MSRKKKDPALLTQFGDVKLDLEYWHKHTEHQPNGCIHWTSGKHRQGYGMCGAFRVADDKRIMTTTHRMAMKMKLNRALLHGENVIHKPGCLPICCNPDHLMIGGQALRVQVMRENGHTFQQPRGKYIRNKKKQNRKYVRTPEEMIWIRNSSIDEIVERYKLTRQRAGSLKHAIKSGYAWLKDYETK